MLRRGATQTVEFTVQVKSGYHVNSNTPADEFLIPLKLTFTPDSAVEVADVIYPKPSMQKLQFSAKPVSVFEGDFKAAAKIKAPAAPPKAPGFLNGKLRYQACSDRECLPPRTLTIKVPVEIRD